jgi:hypothetical protein
MYSEKEAKEMIGGIPKKLSKVEAYEMWKCGKAGVEVGCRQGCEEEYGSSACWECPDPNAPSHAMITAHQRTKIVQCELLANKEEKKQ